jgi:PleD family two-component response regulator
MINHDKDQFRAKVAWFSASRRAAPKAFIDAAAVARHRLTEPGETPDIAIVDLYGADPSSEAAKDAVAAGRRTGANAGLLIAAEAAASAEDRLRCARLGETVFLRHSVEPLIGAVRERLRLATLADEAGDRIKSLIADGRTVTFSPSVPKPPDLSVLIAGRPSPIALAASNAVSAASKTALCVFSAGQAMRALDHSRFHGAVFIPHDENDLLIALARALRRHREHRRLPVVIISNDEELLDKRAAKDGLDVMTANRVGDELFRRLEATTRRSSMAAGMRAFLRSAEGNGGPALAANARLFAQHAIRVLRRADETGGAVSFIALSLSPKRDAAAGGAARAAVDEALRTAARLVRAEDMIARLTTSTLVFMLRGARQTDAERVARRLEGVIAGTQPRTMADHSDVRAAAIERAPGVEIERVIAALVAELRQRRVEAARTTA